MEAMKTLAPTPSRRAAVLAPAISADQWDLARRIHRSMLPSYFRDERVEVAVRYEEHDILGGDYCSVFKTDDDKLFLCVCDVTGHGVAAALLAARINSFVRQEIRIAAHPCQVVDRLNGFLRRHFNGLGVYATFFCIEIDLKWRGVTYAGAGHPPALLWRKPGAIERLESHAPPAGIFSETEQQCQLTKTRVEPGDRLLVFTDGLSETRSPAGEMLGLGGIEAQLAALPADSDAGQMLDQIFAARRHFAGTESSSDDVLVVAASFF
jgi:serine phosphatase RsbU (regulator of sigma subunit)